MERLEAMMSAVRFSMLVLVCLLSTALYGAEGGKVQQPGQLASANDVTPASGAAVGVIPEGGFPATTIANPPSRHERTMNRLLVASMVAAVVGTSLDAASSWGKLESNSFLASSNGTFGAKGVAIKAGFAAGLIVPEILLRKHKDLRPAFIIGNFGEASIFSAAAIHNIGISKPSGN